MGGPRNLSGRLGRKLKSLASPSSTGTRRDDQGIVVRFLAEAIIVCVCTHTELRTEMGIGWAFYLALYINMSRRNATLWGIFVFVEACLFSDILIISHVDPLHSSSWISARLRRLNSIPCSRLAFQSLSLRSH